LQHKDFTAQARQSKLNQPRKEWGLIVELSHMPNPIAAVFTSICLMFFTQVIDAQAQQNKPAAANQCEEHLKVHGLLSRAYAACNYSFYSRGFTIQADDCTKRLGNRDSKQLFVQGTTAFDERVKQMGQATLCAKILKDFPYTVRQ